MVYQKEKLKKYIAELHIHTVLSPCTSIEMIPPLIISEAKSKGVNLIAITDHNSIENIQPVMEAAEGSGVIVLPGIELQTREEIHNLCLFDSLTQIQDFYKEIFDTFPQIENNAEYFGEQYVVDKTGEFIRKEKRLLISSSSLSLTEANKKVSKFGGLLIPAHVNRSAYGLIQVLGFVPVDTNIEYLEISKHISQEQAFIKYPQIKDQILIQNGDAHNLKEIIGFNEFKIRNPSIKEIKMALSGKNYRIYRNRYKEIEKNL